MHKTVGLSWSAEEYESIASQHLPQICHELNNRYTDRLLFTVQAIPIGKSSDSINTLNFEVVSHDNAIDERMDEVTDWINDQDTSNLIRGWSGAIRKLFQISTILLSF